MLRMCRKEVLKHLHQFEHRWTSDWSKAPLCSPISFSIDNCRYETPDVESGLDEFWVVPERLHSL
jgi:hypothetical protein